MAIGIVGGSEEADAHPPHGSLNLLPAEEMGELSPTSNHGRLTKDWAEVEIPDAVGKGEGRGRLELLAEAFEENVGPERIYISGENQKDI